MLQQLVYYACFSFQSRLSEEKLQDERLNRVSSTLIGLGTVMCVSPVCEKKAVFAICQLIKEKNIDTELVKQVSEVQTVTKIIVNYTQARTDILCKSSGYLMNFEIKYL